MRYRQDTKLNSNRKKIVTSQGGKISQVVFDKEITQQWQVKTNEPTEILPYLLKRICLSRKCQFWHQMKFFYFENYEQLTKNQYEQQTWAKQSNLLEDWQESVILVRVTPQRVQQSKRFIKSLWKITRQRLMNAINRIKQHAGVQDESSLQLQDQKLNSYMRFLKLQQNKRIDIAIQTLDSVIEKNTKKKLLNGFLNMRQRLKQVKKYESYRDRIKIQCFVDIVMRSIRRENMGLVKSAFEGIELRGEFEKRRMRHQSKSSEFMRQKNGSMKKIGQSQVSQTTKNHQQMDTINKLKRRKQQQTTPFQSHEKQTNQQSTIKRQVITTGNNNNNNKTNYQNTKNGMDRNESNSKRNMHNDSEIKSISSHEHVVESQYYYDVVEGEEGLMQQREDGHSRHYRQQKDQNIQQREYHQQQQANTHNNINSLPTRRTHQNNHQRHNNNHFTFNQSQRQNEQNININKKTARTPSRITQNFYHSQNLQSQQQLHQNDIKNIKNTQSQHHQTANKIKYHHQLHIPITQRIQKHFYEEHYQQEEQQEVNNQDENMSDNSNQNNSNIHQQICVIRNVSSTPQRKPDRYEKIPIVSNNIEFRQFFIHSSKKKDKKVQLSTHSTSYYENKCCQGCQYCTRLKKINQMMTMLHKNKITTQKLKQIGFYHRGNLPQRMISQKQENSIKTYEINRNLQKISQMRQQNLLISKTQQINAFAKKTSQKQKVSSTQKIMDSSKVSKESHKQQPKPQNTTTNKKVNNSKDEKPSSVLRDIRRSGFTPSRQSLLTKSTYSKGLSQRKVFSRKPMY